MLPSYDTSFFSQILSLNQEYFKNGGTFLCMAEPLKTGFKIYQSKNEFEEEKAIWFFILKLNSVLFFFLLKLW